MKKLSLILALLAFGIAPASANVIKIVCAKQGPVRLEHREFIIDTSRKTFEEARKDFDGILKPFTTGKIQIRTDRYILISASDMELARDFKAAGKYFDFGNYYIDRINGELIFRAKLNGKPYISKWPCEKVKLQKPKF